MKEKSRLIVFAKNLVYGTVKTRLAATVGAQKAFDTYQSLLEKTRATVQQLSVSKVIYYSQYIERNDSWEGHFDKAVQEGKDLGEKMLQAFGATFEKGFTKAVMIGTDCPALNAGILLEAFAALDRHDLVMGPALDGGYYLIGMRTAHQALFQNMAWSTPAVFDTTIDRAAASGLHYAVLPALPDVDEEKDLVHLNLNA